MLRSDDYQLGIGLSAQQEDYWKEINKPAYRSLCSGYMERRYAGIAIMPAEVRDSGNSILRHAYVKPSDILFGIMRDVRTMGRTKAVLAVHSLHLDENLVPTVGGHPDHCHAVFDYFKNPHRPGAQSGIRCRGSQLPAWTWSDEVNLYAVRRGDMIDIMAAKPVLRESQDTIVWRLDRKSIRMRKLTFGDHDQIVGMLDGDKVDLGVYRRGDKVVTVQGDVTYIQFWTKDGEVALEDDDSDMIPANDTRLLDVANIMNRQLSDQAFTLPRVSPPICAPEQYRIRAHAAFTYQQFDSFTSLEGFYCTPRLKSDLLSAIGPFGQFQLLSNYNGRVKDICPDPETGGIAMWFELTGANAGKREACQLFPSTVVFSRNDGTAVSIGDTVHRGQKIGLVMARRPISWVQLQDAIGDRFLQQLIDLYVFYKAIRPWNHDWTGDGVLLDIAYAYPVLQHARHSGGQLDLYLDIRNLQRYYDRERDAIILPVHASQNPRSVLDVVGFKYIAGEPLASQTHNRKQETQKPVFDECYESEEQPDPVDMSDLAPA